MYESGSAPRTKNGIDMELGLKSESMTYDPAFLDTSMIVRYLTRDLPELAERAGQIIEGSPELQITPGTITESAFVLTSNYEVPRSDTVDALVYLLRRSNIRVHQMDKALTIHALLLCRPSARVSFADAMLWAAARSSNVLSTIYTLDRRFPSEGVTLRREL